MEQKIARYFELRQAIKEMEEELNDLRQEIIASFPEGTISEIGDYQVKITIQDRREYDDQALFKALPDESLWRLISKADSSKIASLLKLNVLQEEMIQNTYKVKRVPYIQVSKIK